MRNAGGVEQTRTWDGNDENDCEAWDLWKSVTFCLGIGRYVQSLQSVPVLVSESKGLLVAGLCHRKPK